MAKYHTKFPIDSMSGRLGGIDRTIGRESGLSCTMQKRKHSGHLVSLTAATRGGSEARHERSAVYCDCDTEYKSMTKVKRSWIWGYWKNQKQLSKLKLTNHAIWMTMCLADMYQRYLFRNNSYLARYWIVNSSLENWTNKIVLLKDVSTHQPSGKDCSVWQIDARFNLGSQMSQKVGVPGTVLILIPALVAGWGFYVDLYSYGNYETGDGW